VILLNWQYSVMDRAIESALASVPSRLRALRQQREWTLASVASATGISASTLSRLESGQRRANLELLLPLAQAFGVSLDDLLGTFESGDPRVHALPFTRNGMVFQPLTRRSGGLQAYRLTIPAGADRLEPDLQAHDGYEWLYVLSGRLRLVLGEHELVMRASEAAEFDTRVPHWFTRAGSQAVELLSLFGAQGERLHTRARVRRSTS
jgi:transcriptional regulator with XRE-family HTH domain